VFKNQGMCKRRERQKQKNLEIMGSIKKFSELSTIPYREFICHVRMKRSIYLKKLSIPPEICLRY